MSSKLVAKIIKIKYNELDDVNNINNYEDEV